MKNGNASLFRKMAKVEDAMLRAAMPAISALDFAPLVDYRVRAVIAGRNGTRLVKPLTATLAERAVA